MRVLPFIFAGLALAGAACTGGEAGPDHQAEWRDVLRHKKAAVAADALPKHKQVYADSVRAFVVKHPEHSRAQQVWQRLQLEFADDLAGVGRYQDAIRFYRAVLAKHPESEEARQGLAMAADRLAVTREKLLELEKGMSHRAVASLLGKPMPGWSVKHRRQGTTFEAWYYRTHAGDVAAVYFRDGNVFAAEESSSSQVARISDTR